MDIRLQWLQDSKCQEQFQIHWRPGRLNYVYYCTKHHVTKNHQNVLEESLTPHIILEILRQKQTSAAAAAAAAA